MLTQNMNLEEIGLNALRSRECFAEAVEDGLNVTFKEPQEEKTEMKTEIMLEAANFTKMRGWLQHEELLNANQNSIFGLHSLMMVERM